MNIELCMQNAAADFFDVPLTVAPLGISVDGFPNDKKVTLFEFGNFLLDSYIITQKIDGSRNPLLKIDGFPGTHGTHTNGATAL